MIRKECGCQCAEFCLLNLSSWDAFSITDSGTLTDIAPELRPQFIHKHIKIWHLQYFLPSFYIDVYFYKLLIVLYILLAYKITSFLKTFSSFMIFLLALHLPFHHFSALISVHIVLFLIPSFTYKLCVLFYPPQPNTRPSDGLLSSFLVSTYTHSYVNTHFKKLEALKSQLALQYLSL